MRTKAPFGESPITETEVHYAAGFVTGLALGSIHNFSAHERRNLIVAAAVLAIVSEQLSKAKSQAGKKTITIPV